MEFAQFSHERVLRDGAPAVQAERVARLSSGSKEEGHQGEDRGDSRVDALGGREPLPRRPRSRSRVEGAVAGIDVFCAGVDSFRLALGLRQCRRGTSQTLRRMERRDRFKVTHDSCANSRHSPRADLPDCHPDPGFEDGAGSFRCRRERDVVGAVRCRKHRDLHLRGALHGVAGHRRDVGHGLARLRDRGARPVCLSSALVAGRGDIVGQTSDGSGMIDTCDDGARIRRRTAKVGAGVAHRNIARSGVILWR